MSKINSYMLTQLITQLRKIHIAIGGLTTVAWPQVHHLTKGSRKFSLQDFDA